MKQETIDKSIDLLKRISESKQDDVISEFETEINDTEKDIQKELTIVEVVSFSDVSMDITQKVAACNFLLTKEQALKQCNVKIKDLFSYVKNDNKEDSVIVAYAVIFSFLQLHKFVQEEKIMQN